jgi:hypothetical protein
MAANYDERGHGEAWQCDAMRCGAKLSETFASLRESRFFRRSHVSVDGVGDGEVMVLLL